MTALHLSVAQHRAQPWKNGLGISHTIADFPQAAGFDAVQWQVGYTGIGADCPFSDLPGLDRQFMVIEGAGVELTCTDESGKTSVNRIVNNSTPFAFRGDWRTSCRLLDGPVKVFNVMTRRGAFRAKVEVAAGLDSASVAAGETLLAVALPSLDAWILDGPRPGMGRAVLVRIRKEDS
jgi:environmental stress-induced protein Ves